MHPRKMSIVSECRSLNLDSHTQDKSKCMHIPHMQGLSTHTLLNLCQPWALLTLGQVKPPHLRGIAPSALDPHN